MKGWMVVSKCRNTSILKCVECQDYQCKNLWGPIKENSRCYEMIKNKLFDECVFGCEKETDLNGCSRCIYINMCSTLIRQNVVFFDLDMEG